MENYLREIDSLIENYQHQKLTHEEIRQFQQFAELSDKEIEDISNMIFELAQVAIKVIK